MDKNALLATGVISARLVRGEVCLVLTARGVNTFAASTGDSGVALVGGEAGALMTVESEDTDEMDWWRAGRLERKP